MKPRTKSRKKARKETDLAVVDRALPFEALERASVDMRITNNDLANLVFEQAISRFNDLIAEAEAKQEALEKQRKALVKERFQAEIPEEVRKFLKLAQEDTYASAGTSSYYLSVSIRQKGGSCPDKNLRRQIDKAYAEGKKLLEQRDSLDRKTVAAALTRKVLGSSSEGKVILDALESLTKG